MSALPSRQPRRGSWVILPEAVHLVDLGEADLPGQEAGVGVRRAHADQHVGVGQAAVRTEGRGHGALVDVLGCNTEQCSYNFKTLSQLATPCASI